MDLQRLAKGAAGVIVLVVLAVVVAGWWGDYRSATRNGTTSSTPETTATAGGTGTSQEPTKTDEAESAQSSGTRTLLVVQVDGLNLREKPSGTSKAFRGLDEGEKVLLLGEEGEWYKVQDANGQVGYVTAKASYTTKVTE